MNLNNAKIAVFAGSFDPPTKGHFDIIERASKLFDTLWILVAENCSKKTLFTKEERFLLLKKMADFPNVKIEIFEGLTVDFMAQKNAHYLVRGLRNSIDFNYEQNLNWVNHDLDSAVETIFLMSHYENLAISSSTIRELIRFKKTDKLTLEKFVPASIVSDIHSMILQKEIL